MLGFPDMTDKYYITTPIYYVNDKPHIGHAYTSLACDVISRFKRLDGFDVKFLTGTDEHGQKIEKSALKLGIPPQEFVDQVSQKFHALGKIMNFSNDDFIRTTEKRHTDNAVRIWNQLKNNNQIYLGKYSGWYSVRDEAFYNESELIDGKAPTGADVQWLEEESYFFRLSTWQDKLLELYEEQPDFIKPQSRRNEVISFVKQGLKDLCISRTSFKWGIPIPESPNHIMYVWLDALTNYIAALENNEESEYWPCDLHVVGKDILRFHAIYWPAFLMASDIQIPKRIFAHGWWTNEGQKISKSLGNVIDPIELVDNYGIDYVRYFMMREIPFGNDGNFSQESFLSRINSELVNNIGNLVQRILSFINKHNSGVVPDNSSLEESDIKFLQKAYEVLPSVRKHIDDQEIHLAIESITQLSSRINEYVDKTAPWVLRKTNVKRMEASLYTAVEAIRVIAILLQPIVPESAKNILKQLSLSDVKFEAIRDQDALKPGSKLPEPRVIFPKLLPSL